MFRFQVAAAGQNFLIIAKIAAIKILFKLPHKKD